MHRFGTLDLAARAAQAPVISTLATEPWVLKGAQLLDCRTEILSDPADVLIPPSLHPSIPAYASIMVLRAPESPVGPFTLAEVRIAVRVGASPGMFVAAAVCDSAAACTALAAHWGHPCRLGEVRLEDLHYEVGAKAGLDGLQILDVRLEQRRPLPGTRMNTPALLSLARHGEGGPMVLTHAPVQAVYGQADGGRMRLAAIDKDSWALEQAFSPTLPIGSSFGTGEVTLGAVDILIDPALDAGQSARPVAA